MKILFLTPYPYNQAPSQRFRFEQYFSFLKNSNIDITHLPFLNQKTWEVFYKKGFLLQKITGTILGIINRHILIFKIHKFDFIFIHREACFIGPAYFEWIYAKLFKKKIVYDFDDAIWLRDVSEANIFLGWLKRSNKTNKIISYANYVIAGNAYLAEYAKMYNKNVIVIPTTINNYYHSVKKKKNDESVVKIGWTGSLTTNKHLEMILPVLAKIKMLYGNAIEILMISNKQIKNDQIDLKFIAWTQKSEIEDLSQFDIGIMPLPDDEWAKGKCGFKGLQYMALEIPTIMSPVGVNTEIIQDGINGFLARTENEWLEKLSLLIESKELRERVGKAGRKTVEEKYSVDANKKKYLDLFNKLIEK